MQKIRFDYYRNIGGFIVEHHATKYMGDTFLVYVDVSYKNKRIFTADCYADKSFFAEMLDIKTSECTPEIIKDRFSEIENQIDWEFNFPNK